MHGTGMLKTFTNSVFQTVLPSQYFVTWTEKRQVIQDSFITTREWYSLSGVSINVVQQGVGVKEMSCIWLKQNINIFNFCKIPLAPSWKIISKMDGHFIDCHVFVISCNIISLFFISDATRKHTMVGQKYFKEGRGRFLGGGGKNILNVMN